MKKTTIAISAAFILIAFAFAGCKGADGGKVTDTTDNVPMLTELENELSTIADNMTDMMPDMSGNISDNNTANSNT